MEIEKYGTNFLYWIIAYNWNERPAAVFQPNAYHRVEGLWGLKWEPPQYILCWPPNGKAGYKCSKELSDINEKLV